MSGNSQDRSTRQLDVSAPAIRTAAATLRAGGLVAFPTETVYGLGGDACNAAAVAAIFAAKERPSFNPLISHVDSAEAAFELGLSTKAAEALSRQFWPGPMTLVLMRRPSCPIARLTSAGLDRIALRVPGHPAARRLLSEFGGPVAAPSANPSGRISPTRASHVIAGLSGRIDIVLDGGRCASGVESTVIDCSGDDVRILRPGGVTREDLALCLKGIDVELAEGPPPSIPGQPAQPGMMASPGTMASPGMMASHYAPRATLERNVTTPRAGMELIGFGAVAGAGTERLNLSPDGDLIEAAANLFDMLHRADSGDASVIGVAPIPEIGLGEAINDRLRRAAAPRET